MLPTNMRAIKTHNNPKSGKPKITHKKKKRKYREYEEGRARKDKLQKSTKS